MEKQPLEHSLDSLLRPKSWDEYIGQESVKKSLNVLIKAAKERGQMPETRASLWTRRAWQNNSRIHNRLSFRGASTNSIRSDD